MRLLRLALGIFILGDGIAQKEVMFIIAGAIFTMMPILNIGCCGIGGTCAPNFTKETNDEKEISYEEVHSK